MCPFNFLHIFGVLLFGIFLLAMSLASQGCTERRDTGVQNKHPLAAGEQQEAYRWVPCPRKTKIARRRTGLQRISGVVLNT